MNIAIIISVSEYSDSQNNLPGCKKDADIIHSILSKTSKFEEVLYINEKISSAKVKEKFINFITEHKATKIEELFFYYTGHGEFQNDEFYYLLSDFEPDKRKQTSLQNEEVDNLFRTLQPNLVVKVIDACQSGKSYIKEAGALTKYFQKTIDRFDRCYFLNSSLKDQSSLQSDVISDFTLSFIKSIKDHNTKEIRYKDIIDYISDDFEKNPLQTPFFVVQADYTEKFCSINQSLKDYLDSTDLYAPIIGNDKEGKFSLVDKIKKQASEYYTKEQAIELITEVRKEIVTIELSKDLSDIFDLTITFQENYEGIIQKNTIGKWLDENPHDYFAKSLHSRVRKDRHTNPFGSLRISILDMENEKDYEYIRNGFDIELDVPYKSIIFNLDSKYPNVESYTSRIVYFLSKRLIRFFYFNTNFEIVNWDERKLNNKIEWFSAEYQLHDKQAIIDGIKKILNQLQEKVKKALEENFNSSEPENE